MNAHAVYAKISPHFRDRRIQVFRAAISPQPADTILDIGGTPFFWASAPPARLTLLNSDATLPSAIGENHFDCRVGDGCALPFGNASFDIVFSNSVIEHVGTWERQQAFAREARRVGTRLWIQTPAREFFIEPHLIAPFVHWLPRSAQRRLIRNFTVRGWLDRPGRREVDAFLDEVRLLTFAEMKLLFPDCTILRERFLGMTKSYVAFRTAR